MSHYDGREPHREYGYWTDERVREHLEANGGIDQYCVCGEGLYGTLGPDGAVSDYCMDDDGDRAAAIVKFLTQIGAPRY